MEPRHYQQSHKTMSDTSLDILTAAKYFGRTLTATVYGGNNIAIMMMKSISDFLLTLNKQRLEQFYHAMESTFYSHMNEIEANSECACHKIYRRYGFLRKLLKVYILPHYVQTIHIVRDSTEPPIYNKIQRMMQQLKNAVYYHEKAELCRKLISRHNCNGVQFYDVCSISENGVTKIDDIWKASVFSYKRLNERIFWLPSGVNIDDVASQVFKEEHVADIAKLYAFFFDHSNGAHATYDCNRNKCNIHKLLIKCFGLDRYPDNMICGFYFDVNYLMEGCIDDGDDDEIFLDIETLISDIINGSRVDSSYRKWIEQFWPVIDVDEYISDPNFPTKEQYIQKFILPDLNGIMSSRQKSACK